MSAPQDNAPPPPGDLPREALLELAERSANQAGVAFTRIRRHVYQVLLDANEPLGAYDIVDCLEGIGCAQPATAYRALNCLENLGFVRKIRSISKYVALRTGPSESPLAFVVCRECGTAEQIALGQDSADIFLRAKARGYQDLDKTIELTGCCKDHGDSDAS